MSKNTCPICGKPLDDTFAKFLDNGSPAHSECVVSEETYREEKAKKENE